jgi:glycine cleavage system H protein
MMSGELIHPTDLHYLIEHQVWARVHDDGTATVGITALGIQLAGEIYMAGPRAWACRSSRGGHRGGGAGQVHRVGEVAGHGHGGGRQRPAGRSGRSVCTKTPTATAGWRALMLTDFEADRARAGHGDAGGCGDGAPRLAEPR